MKYGGSWPGRRERQKLPHQSFPHFSRIIMHNVIWLTLIASNLLCFPSLTQADMMKSPWSDARDDLTRNLIHSGQRNFWPELTSPLAMPFVVYHRFLSAIDGRDCPCTPSCSSYSIQAMKQHGTVIGILLTVDRLIHEADEIHRRPPVIMHGMLTCFDPLENNDFWTRRDPASGSEKVLSP